MVHINTCTTLSFDLCAGAEQAADTMLPAVYMCRSLQKTLKSVQYMTNAHSSMHPQSRVMSHCLIPPDLDHALTASSEMKEGDTVSNDPSIEMSMSNSSDLSATGRAYGTDKTLGCDTEDQSAAPAQGYGSAIPFKLLAHVRNGITVRQAIHVACGDATSAGQPVVLAVGPEGGWTAEEVSCFVTAYGYHTVTLGTGRTLDTTTAVIALVSAVAEVLAEQC